MGAIALADLDWHDQAVPGLVVSNVAEHGQTGNGKLAVAAKEDRNLAYHEAVELLLKSLVEALEDFRLKLATGLLKACAVTTWVSTEACLSTR